MWEDVRKVFEHGATKHEDIQPFLEQLEHIKTHYILSQAVECEKESGLPHKAHMIARLLLAVSILDKDFLAFEHRSPCIDCCNSGYPFEDEMWEKVFGVKL